MVVAGWEKTGGKWGMLLWGIILKMNVENNVLKTFLMLKQQVKRGKLLKILLNRKGGLIRSTNCVTLFFEVIKHQKKGS